MRGIFKRILSAMLSATMLTPLLQAPVHAEPNDVYVPEEEITDDILSSDVFYLASSSAQLYEGNNERYLIRLARGGDALTEAGVAVKIADVTAKYGKDYTVSVYGSDETADNPKDNESLLEKMEGEDYTQRELKDDEEYGQMLEDDEALKQETTNALNDAIDYIEEESGVASAEDEEIPTAAPQEQTGTETAAAVETDGTETVNTNPLQAAREMYTGVSGEPQKVTSSTDTFQQIQQMANVVTEAVVGATLDVEFAAGESEKYLAIDVDDNNDGDGLRYFYLMLAAPHGSTTNSAASSCAVNIIDDEEQTPSEVSFSETEYRADGDSVTVEVRREGALNSFAEAKLTTEEGTAKVSRDFSPVDKEIVFPIGIDHITVDIPIRTEYLTGDADFSLKLEAVRGCSIAQDTASVAIAGTANAQSSDEDVELMAIEQSHSVTDIVTDDEIDLTKPVKVGHSNNYSGANYWQSGDKRWRMMWEDNSFWSDYRGTVGASWNITDSSGYDIAGAQIKWSRNGSDANVKAGFVSDRSLDWSWHNYPKKGEGSDGKWEYDSRAYFGETTQNVFSNIDNPVRVTVLNNGNCDDCNNLYIYSIKPIKRPFVINLNDADELTFLNEDGSRTADDGTATYLALAGANNNTNNQLIAYAGDTITLNQQLGMNVSTPYVYLKNIKMTKGENSYTISSWDNDAYTSQRFELTKSLVNDHHDCITFEQNNNSEAWKNQSGTFGKRGRIELKPEFGYKDAEVKINVPENNFGYFKLSGEAKDISSSQTFTYHMGDTIKLSTVMRDEYKDYYVPSGYKISYKMNKSDTDWVKQDVIVPYNLDNATAGYMDTNERLRYGYYEITPLFTRNDNVIAVRVRQDNLWLWDTSYGFFNTPYVEEVTVDGVKYNQYIAYDSPVYGKIYSISGRSKYQNADYCFWNEPGNDKDYTGDVFFHSAGNNPDDNIIYASCHYDYYADFYQDISGTVKQPMYNMTTKQVGYANMLPAEGAVVNFGTSTAVVGADGTFKVPVFRSIGDHLCTQSGDEHYIRYTITYNGEEALREMRLPHNGYSWEETQFTVTDGNGNVTVENQGYFVNSTTVDELINTENAGIIKNIRVSTESQSSGYNIVINGDSVALTADCSVPATYTKVSIDSSGNRTETPNAAENVTGVKFIVYDSETNEQITSCTAEKSGNSFKANLPITSALPGNRLFIQVTTDKAYSTYAQYDETGNKITAIGGGDMNTTTYSPVFTGYTFVQKTTETLPVVQSVDLPIDMTFLELPLVGSTGMAFDLPFVSVGAIKLDNGYRMYIGVGVNQITDTITKNHMTSYAGDTGAYYKDLFSIEHPIDTFTQGLAATYKEAFKNVGENYAGATSALGAPTWKFDTQIGVYFDFAYIQITNPNNGSVTTAAGFSGVGGYVGVSAGFKKAWYTILPVVFIPAYIGLEIDGNVLGFFGAAASNINNPTITYDKANNGTVDFDSELDEFNASVKMAANVQLYMGVGLSGTVGIRGGGQVNAMALWEPSDIVSDWGLNLAFKAGIWVDLFLFTVPLQYTLAEVPFGSFKEYKNSSVTLSTPSPSPDADTVSLSSAEDTESKFRLREPYSADESEWLPDEVTLQSAFSETSSQTVVKNGYEHPDTQVLKLSDGSVFMAFLDNDLSRGETERTVLKYAVYRNGAWSGAKIVQDDGTADFQPSICDMGSGKVMISWISSDPDTEKTGESSQYLSSLEVYTAVIDSAGDDVSEITRLTTDSYYDYTPTSVYDDATGDRAVYYVKTASSGSVEEMANSYTNDCVIVYMLYSAEKGKWLFDEYYDEEVAGETEEQKSANKQTLIDKWNGQRFLSSPISELGIDVPNIADFTATSYNGLAAYAYTIDRDSSNDTSGDKELFVQFYDFETHKTYVPVRITNDSISDALPQIVRTGNGEKANTYLFWYRDEKDIAYINLSELIHSGVNDDGTISDEYLTKGDGEKCDISEKYSYVQTKVENYSGTRSMEDFKAVVDGENIYIVWTQPSENLNNPDEQCREVYATAMIQPDDTDNNESTVGETSANDGEGSASEADEIGCAWSDPYRLTYTNAFTDEPAAAVDTNGNLMVLYNSYNQTITEDAENPVEITDFALKASYMEPCGAVDVTGITLSDETPNPGDTVDLTISVKNTGLTYADGYSVKVYEMKDGAKGSLIDTINSDSRLLPGNTNTYTVKWTVPDSFDGMNIYTEAQEGGMDNISVYSGDTITKSTDYTITDRRVEQRDDGYHLSMTVTNNGNTVSSSDVYNVTLTGPYAMAVNYPAETVNIANASLGGIGIGESADFDIPLKIEPTLFDKYGFIDCYGVCETSDGTSLSEGDSIRIAEENPMSVKLNGEELPETITLNAGDTMDFAWSCLPTSLNENLNAMCVSDDNNVASFDGTTLKALHEGTTTVSAVLLPYGTETNTIEVKVTGNIESEIEATPAPSTEPTTAPHHHSSGGGSSRAAATATPAPTTAATVVPTDKPSATKEPSTRAGGFKDVSTDDWFYDCVSYNAEHGFFIGITDDTFEPYTDVTRGMFVTVLGRMDGVEEKNTETEFTDVESSGYYAAHIAWAAENGIVNGYGDGTFGPNDKITREQMAKMLSAYMKYKLNIEDSAAQLDYTDSDTISDWAKVYVAAATQNGIMSGNDDNTFAPLKLASRAEAAAVIQRLDKLISDNQ